MTNVDLPQSVKVREGYVKGDVKGIHATIVFPHSVKVREGYVKGYVKACESDDFTAVREGPWRFREEWREGVFDITLLSNHRNWLSYRHWLPTSVHTDIRSTFEENYAWSYVKVPWRLREGSVKVTNYLGPPAHLAIVPQARNWTL